VESPQEGTWTVEVKGFNVPYGPQPFALVVDGVDFNIPPTAIFSADPTSGDAPLEVTFDASLSSDPDGAIVRHVWNFGDGGTANVDNPSEPYTYTYTYQAAGQYTVTLTVTDDDGAEVTSDSQTITVTAPPPDTMHLEALSVKTKAGRWFWSMNVTATVKDANGGPVAGATVWYSWSDSPGSLYGDCFTGQNGECSVVGFQFRGTCLTFTVEDVVQSTLTYDPGQNKANDISACK
jgi:PKD repeat protein